MRAGVETFQRLVNRRWFSYVTLALLQIKVMWDVWQYRDLTGGDEASYYNRAFLWFKYWLVDIAWSPLYTSFLGTLMHLSPHAYFVTTLHRIVIVLALSMMILALMRRLLPHWIAWLMAAWWVILPINYDAAFTVHLFAVCPVLIAWLLVLHPSGAPWTRGAALGFLILTTILVRNEYLVATITFIVMCVWWEARGAGIREPGRRPRRRAYLMGYGMPLLIAAGIVLFFYVRSVSQLPEPGKGAVQQRANGQTVQASLRTWLALKHTVNMCQVYAYGHQQRQPEWTKSPWLECGELMEATFGKPMPSLMQMLQSNPVAVLQHFWWNVGLTPNGIQLLLFNASTGTVNPDYAPAVLRSTRALILSLVVGSILVLGVSLLYRDRRYWWEHHVKDNAPGWLAMLAVVAVATVVIPTQRPRPSYLFNQGIVLMAITGMCLFAIARHWPGIGAVAKWLPIIMIGLLVATPSRYHSYGGSRPLLTLYERLAPFEATFNHTDSVFLVSAYPMEVHEYVGHNYFTNPFVNLDYSALDRVPADEALPGVLDRLGVNLFYVDEPLWQKLNANPVHRRFLMCPEGSGWEVLGYQSVESGKWMLMRRQPGPSVAVRNR